VAARLKMRLPANSFAEPLANPFIYHLAGPARGKPQRQAGPSANQPAVIALPPHESGESL